MPSEQKQKKYAYPWAELYDIESRVKKKPVGQGRVGRPASLYIRRRTSLMLSDEELEQLDGEVLAIQNMLRPGRVTKGQVFGLAIRLLEERLKDIEGGLKARSWDELFQSLIQGKE